MWTLTYVSNCGASRSFSSRSLGTMEELVLGPVIARFLLHRPVDGEGNEHKHKSQARLSLDTRQIYIIASPVISFGRTLVSRANQSDELPCSPPPSASMSTWSESPMTRPSKSKSLRVARELPSGAMRSHITYMKAILLTIHDADVFLIRVYHHWLMTQH